VKNGVATDILLPFSVELYSILPAVRLMRRSQLTGIVFTDFAEATRIEKTDLAIYEAIVQILERSPSGQESDGGTSMLTKFPWDRRLNGLQSIYTGHSN